MSFLKYYLGIFFIPTFILGMQDNPLPDCFSSSAIESDKEKNLQTCAQLKAQVYALASAPDGDPRILQLKSAVEKLRADFEWVEQREFINSFRESLLINSIRAEIKDINYELGNIAAKNNAPHDKSSPGSEPVTIQSYILMGLGFGIIFGAYLYP